jgi:hypothetical protein
VARKMQMKMTTMRVVEVMILMMMMMKKMKKRLQTWKSLKRVGYLMNRIR